MKRFADLSITEGVLMRGLLESIFADGRSVGLRAEGEKLLGQTREIEAVEQAYRDYVFGSATLTVFGKGPENQGVIVLVHGNEEDLISDYSVSLEPLIKPINDFIENKAA